MSVKCQFEGCEKSFKCEAKLKDHINSHLGITPFACSICLKKFTCKRYLDAHLKSHNDNFICEKCNVSFTRQHNLKRHGKYCSITFKCPNCDKIYQKKGCYENHLSKCGKQKRTEKRYSISKKPKECICEICKAVFSAKRNMIAHVKSIHEKIRYNCKFCDKKFAHNCSLKRHIRKTHKV